MGYKSVLVVFTHVLVTVLCYNVDANVGIYGGDVVTDIDEAPFMVAIYCNTYFICGGSKIHNQFILTAARCLRIPNCNYTVSLNSTRLRVHFTQIIETYPHKQFNESLGFDYNIGLMKLAEPTDMGTIINVSDDSSNVRDGDELIVYGWGSTENLETNKYLRQVTIPVFNFEKCQRLFKELYESGREITSRMLCAGTFAKYKDSCEYGDSGGPLVKDGVQVGVVSNGGCGTIPGVYTKLSEFTSWIKEHIDEYSDF